MATPRLLYITLQYLRTVGKELKFHWGIYVASSNAPKGWLIHATDEGRSALDLYYECRSVKDPQRSKSMAVCLGVAASPSMDVLLACAQSIPLMDPRQIPRGEQQWTCRVFIKEFLNLMHVQGHVKLPGSIDTIEARCRAAADCHRFYIGSAKIFSNLEWMDPKFAERKEKEARELQLIDRTSSRGGLLLREIPEAHATSYPYYGPSPMNIDSTGGKPVSMIPRTFLPGSGSHYRPTPAPAAPQGERYYGSKPMDTY
ncbi:hypothetical protein S7711_02897 [Stachybotrys chartarum IBT 7711]|uniref:Uncharacterized protein n=1 Tax=Stachybotrys chartarum (strain CBS 109288 / IBT 7711) TaxID=1280523 RepID=A0A084AHB9_STACB|nr:hypothetical protein S7711_02897 [Stachybotrys chartarum IBT 7711]